MHLGNLVAAFSKRWFGSAMLCNYLTIGPSVVVILECECCEGLDVESCGFLCGKSLVACEPIPDETLVQAKSVCLSYCLPVGLHAREKCCG